MIISYARELTQTSKRSCSLLFRNNIRVLAYRLSSDDVIENMAVSINGWFPGHYH